MEHYNGNGNGNGSQQFDWLQLIYQDRFFLDLLSDLGLMPGTGALRGLTSNPITDALANEPGDSSPGQTAAGSFVERMTERYGKAFNRTSLSKLATLCQMFVFDNQRGPEQDGKPKALRRHWYAWFKVKFAQPFARQLGDYELANGVIVYKDIAWSQRLSQTYAWFVDNAGYDPDQCPECQSHELNDDWQNDPYGEAKYCLACDWSGTPEPVTCTYKDLWVEDASRMMARTHGELFRHAHIVVAVEKDSLFADFEAAAKALGAATIISGKGKSSKAAIEKMLRDYFGWTAQPRRIYDYNIGDYRNADPVFTADKPMHVIHVSDHDYDGAAVIGPTFAEQVRRYTPHVKEARVGVRPEDLAAKGYEVADQMYSVKLNNKGYKDWAHENAMFLAECVSCGHSTLTKGTDHDFGGYRQPGNWPNTCQECGGAFVAMQVDGSNATIAYGLEVEAMRTADYKDLLVKALLTILDFDYIVERLRLETIANDQWAAERLRDKMLENNASYQELLAEFERLERRKQRFENAVMMTVWPITSAQADAYPHQGDDPDPADYESHVENGDWGPWRPFSADTRTDMLVEDAGDHTLNDLLYRWQFEYVDDYDIDDFDYIDTGSWN